MSDSQPNASDLARHYAELSDEALIDLADEAYTLIDSARIALAAEIANRRLGITLTLERKADETPLVVLRAFRDLPEALLAKGILDSASIESFLADESIVRLDWFLSHLVGGVKLMVPEYDLVAARALLDQTPVEAFQVEGIGNYIQPKCPACGSPDVSFRNLTRRTRAMFLMGMPIPWDLHTRGWKCDSCGHEWDNEQSREFNEGDTR